ncbi:hypothetical protein [Actibacterium sp. EMB200-NS6]|uniref:hypothetical protein n=1 Tax=Actibacterium sp. EMB200-NS6 TaxID=1609966 RepID=UPI0035176DD4
MRIRRAGAIRASVKTVRGSSASLDSAATRAARKASHSPFDGSNRASMAAVWGLGAGACPSSEKGAMVPGSRPLGT